MNSLSEYILEKFKISKNINNKFSPDSMTGDDILIYSDEPDDEGESQDDNQYLGMVNKKISKKYYSFIGFRHEISESKDFEKDFISMDKDYFYIFEKIVDGDDAGYEIKLKYGRIDIACLNSGSKAHYYIYALTKEGYDNLDEWANGETDDTTRFFDEKNFEPIEDVTII